MFTSVRLHRFYLSGGGPEVTGKSKLQLRIASHEVENWVENKLRFGFLLGGISGGQDMYLCFLLQGPDRSFGKQGRKRFFLPKDFEFPAYNLLEQGQMFPMQMEARTYCQGGKRRYGMFWAQKRHAEANGNQLHSGLARARFVY